MAPDPDPLIAVLDQLAACGEHLDGLDTREAAHFAELGGQLSQLAAMITTISRTLAEDTAALARLDALDRQVTALTSRVRGAGGDDGEEGYQPRPVPAWWKLTPDERSASLAELGDWAERVYRPGYGHLAAALGPCWPEHDLCLYGLDILSQLCGAPSTSSPLAAPACCPPRPSTRPASSRLSPHNWPPRPLAATTTLPPDTPGAPREEPGLGNGTGLRSARLVRLPLPARPENPRHPARLPRRHH
jgi:hypothetical protein